MLCIDTSPSMDTAPLDESDTRLVTATKIASRIVQQKVSVYLVRMLHPALVNVFTFLDVCWK